MSELKKGIFLFTLDTELSWGTNGNPKYREDYERTRLVVDRLLQLLNKYRISATWAVVGKLFEPGEDPLWHAPDIVEKIRQSSVPQEIGSHSYSHIVSEDICDESMFVGELKASQAIAGRMLRSFVYPKNRVKFPERLGEYGFTVYRSEDNVWYGKLPRLLRKIGHGIDNYFIPTAPVGDITRAHGITVVPGNYFFVHRRGWARFLPVSNRVRKVRAGLKRASTERRVFHLWTHPFNLASDPEGLLRGLEDVFATVRKMIDEGSIENVTMDKLPTYV
jgi:peptidoglycan/xylan/chitin deacetylase (PgdA/CDA1 family)